MLRLTVVAVLVAVAAAMEWEDYKKAYGKVYGLEEDLRRQQIYKANLADIEAHNAKADRGESSFRMGVNQFADMTNEEFRKRMNGLRGAARPSSAPVLQAPASTAGLPSYVDWRTQGYVTPVKDQGFCGSCWAFSATGSLEGQHFRKTGKLVSLSEKNLMDCSRDEGNDGCCGGWVDRAFNYIKIRGGVDTEAAYPYDDRDNRCQFDEAGVGATLTGYQNVLPPGSEDALQLAVARVGPVSVAIDASSYTFKHYSSGVYVNPDCSSVLLDHAVLVVGYGTEDGLDYWLVKNSWNHTWGDEGYIKMARNENNMCGIASKAIYPIV